MKQKLFTTFLVCFLSCVFGGLIYEACKNNVPSEACFDCTDPVMNQFCQSTCNTCVNINGTNKSVSATSIPFGQPRSGLKYIITYNDSQNCFLDVNINDSNIYCNPTNWTEFYLVDVPSTISLTSTGHFQLLSSVSAGASVYSFCTEIMYVSFGYSLFGQVFDFPTINLYTYKVSLLLNSFVTNLLFSIPISYGCVNFNSLTLRVYLLVSEDNLFNNVFIDLQNMLYDYSKLYLSNEQFEKFILTPGPNRHDLLNLYNFASKKYSGSVNYIGIIVMPENRLTVGSYCNANNNIIKLDIAYGTVPIVPVYLDSVITFNTDMRLLFNQNIPNHPLTSIFTYKVNLFSNVDVSSVNFSIDNSNNCNVYNNLTMSIYLLVSEDVLINSINEVQKLYGYSMLYLSNKPFVDFVLRQGYNSIDLVNLFNDAKNNYHGVVNYISIIVISKNISQNNVLCLLNQNNASLLISFGTDIVFQGAVSFQSANDNKYLRLRSMVIRLDNFSPTDYAGDRSFYVHQKDSYLSIQSAHPAYLLYFIGKYGDNFKILQNVNVLAFTLVVIGLVVKNIVSINRYSVNVTISSFIQVQNLNTDFVIKCKDPNDVINLYPVTNYVAVVSSLQGYTLYKFSAGVKNEFGFYVYGQVLFYQTDEDVPSGCPRNFTVATVNFTNLKLSWTEVESSLRNGIIVNYIYWCNSSDYSFSKKVDNNTFNAEINNLIQYPDSIYNCSVAACTKLGCGVQAFAFNITLVRNVSKTLWKVLNDVTLQGHLLLMNLHIYPTFNESLNADVEFDFYLPPYLSFTFGSVIQNFIKVDGNRIKYYFTRLISSSETFNYNFTALFDDTKCPLPGIFTLNIPLKITIQVELGKPTVFFKAFRKVVECFGYPYIPIFKDQLILKESYGRGIYWDAKDLNIYVCMNQHFPSAKVACYVSNDEGSLWYELDVRVGSVLGHHLLTNELYAIHRNQKAYMVFHNIHKKWLIITKQQFTDTAFSFIDPSMRKNLEGDYNQVYTLGPNNWLGNAQGLFFLHKNGTWILRIRWRF
ncbi:uncharacterized protein LOC105846609 isoform X2 [Hydra vulgaris]|uniref:Uncharacterized protein LOC105846609 isoform X2 n=1 Tax=Hydra vulgaris TaxID=6087 RepID=A0ABM4CY29_HYDVU